MWLTSPSFYCSGHHFTSKVWILLEMERMEKTTSLSYKPHFFQPVLPGSSSAHFLPIPKAFQRDYLVNGEDSEGIATLKSPLKSWKVKLNGFRLTDGWEEFFNAHNLSIVEDDREESHDDEELDEVDESGTSLCLRISKYPYFTATMKRYNIGRSFLAIPNEFSKAKIPDDLQSVVLKDEQGRQWGVKLIRRKDWYGVMLGCSWYGFQSEKGLKKGDVCLFEQEDEGKMELTVSIVRK